MAIVIDATNNTVSVPGNGVSSVYFEQADAPAEAKAGDTWRDTDTDILAYLKIDSGIRIWMEV